MVVVDLHVVRREILRIRRFGKISFAAMAGVMFQYGRKTTDSIESLNTGVALSSYSWPTMTFISSDFCPLSYA